MWLTEECRLFVERRRISGARSSASLHHLDGCAYSLHVDTHTHTRPAEKKKRRRRMASCKVRDVAILSFKWGGRRRRKREWWMCCVCVIVYRVPPLLVVELARSRMFLLTRYNASTSSLLWPGNDPRCVAGLLSLSLFHSMCIKDDSVLLLLLGRHTN